MKKIFLTLLVFLTFFTSNSVIADSISQKGQNTYEFVDSVGRKVMIPKNISKIVPSGTNAQLVLAGFSPEKMVGIAKKPSKETLNSIKNFPIDKPEIGQYYGKNPNFNKEELIKVNPQIIIDLGEKKKTIKDDMEQISENTGLPIIFIELTPETAPQAYRTLGKVLNKEKLGGEIANFLEEKNSIIKNTLKTIPDNEKLTFIQVGNNALNVDPSNSSHTEAIEFAGGINKAPSKEKGAKSKTENLNMEEVMSWDPDVIFAKDKNSYDIITTNPAWSSFKAVKNGKVYLIPQTPYNWVTSPPSANKMMGIYWAAKTLYPKYFTYDLKEIETKFNKLIYGIGR